MAYWIHETATIQNMRNYRSYYCDYRSDIPKLPRAGIKGEPQINDSVSSDPCSYGSDCTCLEDSSFWVLGKDTNEWKELGI